MRARRVKTEEGFFLAGRKLGRTLQFFLNFGNASDANGAVSTASVVYQQGVPGIWISFQTIFMNPYYWFMSTWFRRARPGDHGRPVRGSLSAAGNSGRSTPCSRSGWRSS